MYNLFLGNTDINHNNNTSFGSIAGTEGTSVAGRKGILADKERKRKCNNNNNNKINKIK